MKNKILIIENNFYKFFAAKLILESKFRLQVNVKGALDKSDLKIQTRAEQPNVIIYNFRGEVSDLLNFLEKRNVNRRNTEVTLLITHELSQSSNQDVISFISEDFARNSHIHTMAA